MENSQGLSAQIRNAVKLSRCEYYERTQHHITEISSKCQLNDLEATGMLYVFRFLQNPPKLFIIKVIEYSNQGLTPKEIIYKISDELPLILFEELGQIYDNQ